MLELQETLYSFKKTGSNMDIPEKFWRKWIKLTDDLDYKKRDKHLEPIIENIESSLSIEDKKLRKRSLLLMINSYLEDFMYLGGCNEK